MKFGPDRVWLSGEEVSLAIRAEAIGNRASAIAVHQPVRDALTKLQRDFRKLPGLVADGRDMGTVIFPDAQLKVFLTASVEARARRRYKQLIDKEFLLISKTFCVTLRRATRGIETVPPRRCVPPRMRNCSIPPT